MCGIGAGLLQRSPRVRRRCSRSLPVSRDTRARCGAAGTGSPRLAAPGTGGWKAQARRRWGERSLLPQSRPGALRSPQPARGPSGAVRVGRGGEGRGVPPPPPGPGETLRLGKGTGRHSSSPAARPPSLPPAAPRTRNRGGGGLRA